MRILYRDVAIGLVALSLAGWTLPNPPSVETVLYSFKGVPGDGALPFATLIADKEGALYGTTSRGGISSGINVGRDCAPDGCGTVFKLTPPAKGQTAWTETVLYSFKGYPTDGEYPTASLIADKEGALYGTTVGGGIGRPYGTVFKLTPPAKGQTAWTETVLYSFKGGPTDGANLSAGLIVGNDGALYSTTYNGGSQSPGCPDRFGAGCGTVFKLTPPAKGQTAWTETVLYSFKGGPTDGANPFSGVIADKTGALYGTAGGGSGSFGIVFKLTSPAKGQTAWTETVLYNFKGGASDGANPNGLIADKEGALYGTTYYGGSSVNIIGNGTVFKLAPRAEGQTAWTESVLYSFKGGPSDGGNPSAGLIADNDGALYGPTVVGGTSGFGTVFKLTPPGRGQTAWTESVLYSFGGDASDGRLPQAGLVGNEGTLYGTTYVGGSGLNGTVFKLTLCSDNNGDHDGCPVFLSQE
ncbi:MAG TPA: choice-of-anchor tandem repeat GloVer-containing protein [Methylocella sp.]|jgi:uncharacterized repeat protein (TIGR03803 family)